MFVYLCALLSCFSVQRTDVVEIGPSPKMHTLSISSAKSDANIVPMEVQQLYTFAYDSLKNCRVSAAIHPEPYTEASEPVLSNTNLALNSLNKIHIDMLMLRAREWGQPVSSVNGQSSSLANSKAV